MPQLGIRSTSTSITTEARIIRDVDSRLTMVEPNETAFTTFMMGLKQNKPVKSPRIEHFEDELLNSWVITAASTNANASSTTITLSDGSGVTIGDVLMVPSGSSSSHERMIVTAKPSINVCTVLRNVGSTGLLTVASGAGLVMLGQAFEEGSGAPVAKRTTPVLVTNYTQIFKKSVNITGTDEATEKYADGGDERKRQRQKMMMEYKKQLNYQFLWGSPFENLTGGANGLPIRTTGGLYHYVATNRMDAGGMLTQKEFETFARMAFRFGSKTKMLLASPLIISAMNMWAKEFLTVETAEKTFGVDTQKVITGHGTFILARDWSLEDGVSGQAGLGNYAFAIDYKNVGIRYLQGRNTWTELNREPNDEDRSLDLTQGELGMQVKNEKTHAMLFGVTDFEAA